MHDVQCIEDIIIAQFCHDENVIHELNKWSYSGHIVVQICSLELCVIHAVNDGGW